MKEADAKCLAERFQACFPGRVQASPLKTNIIGGYGVQVHLPEQRRVILLRSAGEEQEIREICAVLLGVELEERAKQRAPRRQLRTRHQLSSEDIAAIRQEYGPHRPRGTGRGRGLPSAQDLAEKYHTNPKTILKIVNCEETT